MNEKCASFQEEMGIYLWEEMPEDLKNHLQGCSSCKDYWEGLGSIHEKLPQIFPGMGSAVEEKIKEDLKKTFPGNLAHSPPRERSYWPLLVAASLAFVAGIWVGRWNAHPAPEKKEKPSIESQKKESPGEPDSQQMAKNLSQSRLTVFSVQTLQWIKNGVDKEK